MSKYNILVLSSDEQRILNFILYMGAQREMSKIMIDMNKCSNQEEIIKAAGKVLAHMNVYSQLVANIPSIFNSSKDTLNKMFYFAEQQFEVLEKAFETYDRKLATLHLEENQLNMIDSHLNELYNYIKESSRYKYTIAELKSGKCDD